MPNFYDGEIVAFAANKAHWTEVGGKDPGSWTTDATEVYQEGLQFPCVKLFDRGTPIESVVDLIRANVRLPDMTLADCWPASAACAAANRGFGARANRSGGAALKRPFASRWPGGDRWRG